MKTMKKFFASLLVLCMVLTMPNIAANAAEGTGTEEDPVVIETLGETTTTIAGGDAQTSYYYSYTAPSTLEGTAVITVSVSSVTDGVYYAINMDNMTTYDYGQVIYHEGWGYDTTTDTVKIAAGETVIFKVYNFSLNDTYPGFDITWNAELESVGTADSPEDLGTVDSYGVSGSATVTPSADGYFYSYTATEEGHLAFYFNQNYSDPADEATLVPEFVLTNKTTNTTVKYSESTDTISVNMRGMTYTYNAVKLAVKPGDEVIVEVKSNATDLSTAVVGWNAVFVYPEGTQANPIVVGDGYTPENLYETTVPAGTTYYYNVSTTYDGYQLTISGTGDYSVVNPNSGMQFGEKNANGDLVGDLASMWGSIALAITNNGDEDITLTWSLLAPEGSQGNPVEIEMEEGKTSAEVTYQFEYVENPIYGGVVQYFYKYVATEDGYVRVTISGNDGSTRPTYNVWSDEAGSYVDVTVEGEVWYYYAYNTAEDGDVLYDFSKVTEEGDTVVNGQLIEVKAGDVVVIELQALDPVTGMWVDSTITAEVEYVTPDAGSVENAIGAIENTEEGDEAAVEIVLKDAEGNATMVIPADVLAALKDKNISAVITKNFYSWVINGKDIETPEALDLTINFDTTNIPEALVNKALGDAEGGQFSLADNADFGLIAALVFSIADEYEGEDFSLFYYNADGNLECVGNDVVEDGLLAFAFEHASDYVLMQGDVEEGTIVAPDVENPPAENPPAENPPADEPDMPDKGDMANMMVYVIVLMGAALVVAGFVAKKRFA